MDFWDYFFGWFENISFISLLLFINIVFVVFGNIRLEYMLGHDYKTLPDERSKRSRTSVVILAACSFLFIASLFYTKTRIGNEIFLLLFINEYFSSGFFSNWYDAIPRLSFNETGVVFSLPSRPNVFAKLIKWNEIKDIIYENQATNGVMMNISFNNGRKTVRYKLYPAQVNYIKEFFSIYLDRYTKDSSIAER